MSLADECIKKIRLYLYDEYYLAIKNKTMPFAVTRMDLQIITLNEIYTEKDK